MIKICKHCGEPFETNNPQKIYCNRPHYRPRPICGKPVKMIDNDFSRTPKCCSTECAMKEYTEEDYRKTEKQDNTECRRTGHQNQIFLIRSSMVDTKHHFDFSPPNMCRIADCFFTARISGYRRSRRHFGSSFRRGICGEQHRNHTHKDTADDTDNTDTK